MPHDPADAARQQQIQQLTQLANGLSPVGDKVSMQQRLWAGEQLRKIALEQAAEQRRQEEVDRTHGLEEDKQRHTEDLDQSRLMLEAELERRKLDQEDDRIEVQKAEVVLRALEIAARNPELTQLTQVVGELSFRLLGGESLPNLLEDKSEES
jgi:hypothetical protein